jgi:hypothetical protein
LRTLARCMHGLGVLPHVSATWVDNLIVVN